MALRRADLEIPTLPREVVSVDSLGGGVVVRGMLLSERLQWTAEYDDQARFEQAAKALACCVVDDDGAPLLTVDEWQAHGARHMEECLRLFEVVRRFSGLGGEVEKKSDASPSE